MTNRASMGHVYDQLKQEGSIEDENFVGELASSNQDNSPWYIQGLMGCGGWIAALFMLGVIGSCIGTFFFAMNENAIGFMLLIIGAIFVFVTTTASRNDNKVGVFVTQLSLTIHIAGQLLIAGGLMQAFGFWATDIGTALWLLIIIAIQMAFIVWYPNAIYRFLAMLAITWCLNSIAFIYEIPMMVSLITGALMVLGILIWSDKLPEEWQIQRFDLLQAIGYGAVIGAFSLVIYEVTNRYIPDLPANTAIITAIVLFICLIWLESQLLSDYDIRLTSPFALVIFGISLVVSLPTIGTPGILAGIIVILLAFRRRNRVLLGIAYLYLGGFVIYYYYSLEVTLLTKSIILMVTGVLLIAGRLLLRRIVIVPDEKKGLSS